MNALALILPSAELGMFTLIGLAGGLYLFIRGFRLLARKRLLLNTPTSKIRSASLGLVEVGGLATGPYTMPAPITGKACFLYQSTVWQQKASGKDQEWEKVAEESLQVPFFLNDSTGHLLIAPDGAELDLHRDFHEEYDSSFFSTHEAAPVEVVNFLVRHGVTRQRNTRVDERCIKPKDALFVVGTLAENPGVEVRPVPPTGGNSHPLSGSRNSTRIEESFSTPPEVVRLSDSPNPAPAADLTQQSRIAAALTKAGITNPGAWAAAGVPYSEQSAPQMPRVSQISVVSGPQGTSAGERPAFDVKPPVVLMKGANNPAFMISWRSQQDFVGSLAWKSASMIWGGGALMLLGVYVLLAQMELW